MSIDPSLVHLLGVPEIDGDHLRLVEMANRIGADLEEGSYELCVSLFDEFLCAAQDHFRREEALLARAGFRGLEGHIAYHDELLAKVRRLKILGYEKTAKDEILRHYESMAAFVLDDIFRGDQELLACLGNGA